MTNPESTASLPAADDSRRALLHPLKNAGIGESAGTGAWVRVRTPGELEKLHFPEDNPVLGAGISSVPTPWARLELFRDAVRDAPRHDRDVEGHPFSGDALQDILDALELLLFQRHLHGVVLNRRQIDLKALASLAEREHEQGVARFLSAARDLAPRIDGDATLNEVTVVTSGSDQLLFATSPFTLFFTPEDRTSAIPGYFAARQGPRPLAARPPELAGFIAAHLVPALARHRSQHDELARLAAILERQLEAVPPAHRALADEDLDLDQALHPVPGVAVGQVRTLRWTGPHTLLPTREPGAPVLAFSDPALEREGRYFPWLEPAAGTRVASVPGREQLPGTAWRHRWVNPEADFLVDSLLVLQGAELDLASVQGSEIYDGMSSEVGWRRPGQILLPLTAEYFRHFGPADAVRHLRMVMSPDGTRVEARLTLPTAGGPRSFSRVYTRGENLTAEEFYLSVWPGFVPAPESFEWPHYAVFHLAVGRQADEYDVLVGTGGREVRAEGEFGAPPLRRFVRDPSATFYSVDGAPEYLRVRLRRFPGAGEHVAEGVVLPRLETVRAPAGAPWSVAVDMGTSNTSVAVRRGPDEPVALLNVAAASVAARRDLVRPEASLGGSGEQDLRRRIGTLFYPDVLPPAPFPTLVERTAEGRHPGNEMLFQLPAATANIPFSGDVVRSSFNRLQGDLKWGGGLLRAEQSLLTEQFLKQLLMVVCAESVRSGARLDWMTVRFSYPSAFTTEEVDQMIQRWRNVVRWFRTTRLGAAPGGAVPTWRVEERAERIPDESTAALWFFKGPEFSVHDEALALTVDLGGGTTDVAGYADGGAQFRGSVLLAGRDLVGSPENDDGPPPPNQFSGHVLHWALERIRTESNRLAEDVNATLAEYATSHGKFGFLVRHPWFAEHRTELLEEPWFRSAQACIAYFFGGLFFHLGMLVRADAARDGGAGARYLPLRRVIFGGNGARLLEWLTGFAPFDRARGEFFTTLFGELYEAGRGGEHAGRLEIGVTRAPKQEVALGLLTAEAEAALRQGDRPGTGPDEDGPAIRILHPVGEPARFPDRPDGVSAEARVQLSGHAGALFSFAGEFEDSSIRRFHTVFLEAIGRPGAPHSDWLGVRDRLVALLRECDRSFYITAVRGELERQLQRSPQITPSVFAIEVSATLRHLQSALFPQADDGNG